MPSSKTAIVIVNWNSWEDTARCITACAKLQDFHGSIFVVDNASTDGSYGMLQRFLSGDFHVETTGPCEEIASLETDSANALEFRLVSGDEGSIGKIITSGDLTERTVFLVRSEVNHGFGAGNNIGIRLALLSNSFDLFWCLNGDAIPLPESLQEIEKICMGDPSPLLAGSVLLEYQPIRVIQTFGSDFSRLSFKAQYKFSGESEVFLRKLPIRYDVDYPVGAALVMNRAYVLAYGMFDERYFLYFEEMDLAIRLKNARPFICTKSLVYHKGAQTTGGGTSVHKRSLLSDYHYNRSRMILARKMGFTSTAFAVIASAYSLLRRIMVGRFDLAVRVLPAVISGWKNA